MTAADLQSSLGGKDVGVIENLTIAKVQGAPAAIAMTVSLPKGSASPHASTSPRGRHELSLGDAPPARQDGGVPELQRARACGLPSSAEAGRCRASGGGDAEGRASDGFVARMAWRARRQRRGDTAHQRATAKREAPCADREGFAFPRGRWVKLEQEVVLNTPKQADGILRVWADGRLAVDRTDMTYRTRSDVTLSGVAADVFYGTEEGGGLAPADTQVSLTPFELRW